MVVNHEYTNSNLMLAGIGEGREARLRADQPQAEIEMAAHGGAVIEIPARPALEGRRRQPLRPPHRRQHADAHRRASGGRRQDEDLGRPLRHQGAGHVQQLRRRRDAVGHLADLRGELLLLLLGRRRQASRPGAGQAYGLGRTVSYAWGKYFDRFNFDKEPNEPNRFGWIVEIDPYDPQGTPVKRTALGRFAHEGCHHAVAKDGRVVCYMGDD